MPSTRFYFLCLFCLLALSSCGGSPDEGGDEIASLKAAAIKTYADIVHASYADSYEAAAVLETKIKALVAAPSAAALQEARDAWLAAREPYGQTEAYRFYGGPIDAAGGPETLINAWPMDEAYIDYVEGAPLSGIINDPAGFPRLDVQTLVGLNEDGAEENISVGFHALEFLLWGQDFSDDGPGRRPYTDYLAGGGATHPQRRGLYLVVCAELLRQKLEYLVGAWDPTRTDNYRAELLAADPDEALARVLTGIGVLAKAELAGERLFTAYDNQDQEDEHSCFSDNTHRDIINNVKGIDNVYRGRYLRRDGSAVEGTGLDDVAARVNPRLNQTLIAGLDGAAAAAAAIHVPFDQAIVLATERPQVLDTVRRLQKLGNGLAQLGAELGLRINTALP